MGTEFESDRFGNGSPASPQHNSQRPPFSREKVAGFKGAFQTSSTCPTFVSARPTSIIHLLLLSVGRFSDVCRARPEILMLFADAENDELSNVKAIGEVVASILKRWTLVASPLVI